MKALVIKTLILNQMAFLNQKRQARLMKLRLLHHHLRRKKIVIVILKKRKQNHYIPLKWHLYSYKPDCLTKVLRSYTKILMSIVFSDINPGDKHMKRDIHKLCEQSGRGEGESVCECPQTNTSEKILSILVF